MSWLGIVLVSAFSANALLTYGLGSGEALRKTARAKASEFAGSLTANFLTSAMLWSIRTLLLTPLGLARFEVVVFALIVAPLVKYLSQLAENIPGRGAAAFFRSVDESTLTCLVFGVALLSTRPGFGLAEALAASVASMLGYIGSIVLLDGVRRRIELSSLPKSLRDGPAMLVSAGLMAMAFSGIDSRLIANLVK
jgi:electron transport complex protein RnfA